MNQCNKFKHTSLLNSLNVQLRCYSSVTQVPHDVSFHSYVSRDTAQAQLQLSAGVWTGSDLGWARTFNSGSVSVYMHRTEHRFALGLETVHPINCP